MTCSTPSLKNLQL